LEEESGKRNISFLFVTEDKTSRKTILKSTKNARQLKTINIVTKGKKT